jgi:hypothetical protein
MSTQYEQLKHSAYDLGADDHSSDNWTDEDILIYAAELVDSPVDLGKLGPTQKQTIIHHYNLGRSKRD